jgi:hypothetical protein
MHLVNERAKILANMAHTAAAVFAFFQQWRIPHNFSHPHQSQKNKSRQSDCVLSRVLIQHNSDRLAYIKLQTNRFA